MSSNYYQNSNKRGGGGRGGQNKKRNYNNRNYNRNNFQEPEGPTTQTSLHNNATTTNSLPGQQQTRNGNDGEEVYDNAPVSSTTQVLESSSSSSSSSGGVPHDEGDSTGVFNTADEGEDSVGDRTVQEISSEDEEPERGDGDGSVVNASLIVNLSKAEDVVEERRVSPVPPARFAHGDNNTHDLRIPEIVLIGASPVKMERDDDGNNKAPGCEDDDDVMFVEEVVKGTQPCGLVSSSSHGNPEVIELDGSDDDGVGLGSSSGGEDEDSEVEKLMGGLSLAGRVVPAKAVDSSVLPSTVTVLTAPNGVVVYLVGTAHFSQQSQLDVVKTIQATQPTIVLLELCSSRKNILELDEETVLKEVSEMNFQKVRLALQNGGTVQGTLHLLLLSMSAQLTKKLGMAPGGEFRVGAREARKIPGCVVLLGDRPFNITIARALASLSFFQKIKLAWQFVTCNEDITREEIEKCKEKDLLERMLTEMTGEFPSITEVFVNERDVYLAHSLYLSATSDAHRSNGGPIVGVVGMGHVAGITRNWGNTTDSMVTRVIRVPEKSLASVLVRKGLRVLVLGVVGYGVFRVLRRVSGGGGSRFGWVVDGVKGVKSSVAKGLW